MQKRTWLPKSNSMFSGKLVRRANLANSKISRATRNALLVQEAMSQSCIPCASGTIPSREHPENCTDCPEGFVAAAGTTSCTPCKAGTAPNEGRSVCVACEAGTFARPTEVELSGNCVCEHLFETVVGRYAKRHKIPFQPETVLYEQICTF